ncbi:MAG: hypothetical protein AVDCRST_MAG93-6420 [uncultured Chloroflexia bacterium]|uniref:Uncharacterized protein n=1 Tax=uncultured Chloroflexia bacterium TaxID=1672391 RepID=A0A6J4LKH1_9CHLR|nr:MAG: hypothetical protein AVDCRST_MAG93-6420 [uncultured Chloroflexia bacterium]
MIRFKGFFHLLPQGSPLVIGQQLLLPLTVQERSGLTTETINHMTIVDAARSADLLVTRYMDSG